MTHRGIGVVLTNYKDFPENDDSTYTVIRKKNIIIANKTKYCIRNIKEVKNICSPKTSLQKHTPVFK